MNNHKFNEGTPVFHNRLGLGVVTMNSYEDEDWAMFKHVDGVETVFKKDLMNSNEIFALIRSQ
nr:hypothetical protein [Paenibacillus xylanexedens]